MSTVYTRRLSGPQSVETTAGNVLHLTVPTGRVYVVRQLLIVATGSSALDVRVTLKNVAAVFASCFSVVVPGNTAVGRDVLLPLVAGEQLYAYIPSGGPTGLLTMSGYDFAAE
jgi:hypothetical protein